MESPRMKIPPQSVCVLEWMRIYPFCFFMPLCLEDNDILCTFAPERNWIPRRIASPKGRVQLPFMFRVPRLIGSQKGRVRNNMREVYHNSGASRSAFI